MTQFIFFARVGIFLLTIIFQPAIGARQDQHLSDDTPIYVVIGAFAFEDNAVKFATHANELHYKAEFDINQNRNLYYVFVLVTSDKKQAFREALRLRKETPYNDAWVYQGILGKGRNTLAQNSGVDTNPVTEETMRHVEASETLTNDNAQPTASPLQIIEVREIPHDTAQTQNTVRQLTETTLRADEIEGKNFWFQIFRASDQQSLDGDIDEIDTDRSRRMASYKANRSVKVGSPNSKSGTVSFVCEVFGYRKTQKEFNFKEAMNEVTLDNEGNIVIPFELVRLQKGDIAVMYNVYFFKDAAIMRPESRYEINSLLDMLKENSKYKIKIHGHTNGNAAGKIISMGESKNYFSLTDTKDGFGSAKKLSEERALCIQEYLIANGIDPSRMLIKAWGGKRPIHDRNATRAHENVRVEVEILED